LAHYSGEMVSEFHLLAEKIGQLADLAQSLRRENAELRARASALSAENVELSRRMVEAHRRVSALLEKIPLAEQDEEPA
jgi:cell division protein ZapB